MYEINVRVKHDCPYSRIASLFDFEIYEFCTDLYDLLVIPKKLNDYEIDRIRSEINEPDSLEIYTPNQTQNTSYVYFICMCNRDVNLVPTIERHGGMVQYPIRYRDGYEFYRLISLNNKIQAAILGAIKNVENVEILRIIELEREGIFQSQFFPVKQLINSLTDRQIEVIVQAYKRGYYKIPRGTRTADLANEFEVTRPAIEKSLRKAENQILENVIPYLLIHQRLFNDDFESHKLVV